MKNNASLLCQRRSVLLAITGTLASLAGCGGGGSDFAGLTSGGTGSFTSGTITGLGSIIVNGIRYNDDSATKLNTDDSSSGAATLQLGMVVSIEGTTLTSPATSAGLPTATATRITYGSEWKGPVSNIDTVNLTFDILGLRVDVLTSTVIVGEVQSFTNLSSAHYVEVYGYVSSLDGHLQASRIEVSSARPNFYKLSGLLKQLNLPARSAALGSIALRWGSELVLPAGLANDTMVRVRLDPMSLDQGWTVSRLSLRESPTAGLKDDHEYEAEIHGHITAYTSAASFTVNGIPVSATGAHIQGTLGEGVQVEVKGSMKAGQLMATRVETKTEDDIESKDFEFIGQLSEVTDQSFVLREETFTYDSNTEVKGLILSMSATPRVEVKARRTEAGAWYAIEVKRED